MRVGIRNIRIFLLLFFGVTLQMQAWQRATNAPLATTGEIRLAPPKVVIDSVIYRQKARVEAFTGVAGSSIHFRSYSAEEAPIMKFDGLLKLEQTGNYEFWSEHPEYQSSDTVAIEVVRVAAASPQFAVLLETPPHENYQGLGAQGLNDLQKGSTNFRATKHWLGYQEEEVKLSVDFEHALAVSSIRVGLLQDSNSWILLPGEILVESEGEEVGRLVIPPAEPGDKTASLFHEIPLLPGKYQTLKITVKPQVLPAWHQGAGSLAWIFIDEILIDSP